MRDFDYYIKVGTEHFGLSGPDLHKWVTKTMKEDRDQEDKERAEAKEVRAHEIAKQAEAEKIRTHELTVLQMKKDLADKGAPVKEESKDSNLTSGSRETRGPAFRFTPFLEK